MESFICIWFGYLRCRESINQPALKALGHCITKLNACLDSYAPRGSVSRCSFVVLLQHRKTRDIVEYNMPIYCDSVNIWQYVTTFSQLCFTKTQKHLADGKDHKMIFLRVILHVCKISSRPSSHHQGLLWKLNCPYVLIKTQNAPPPK